MRTRLFTWFMEKITSWYLTKRNIAWIGACGHHRSPDVLLSAACPACKEEWE